MLLWPVEFMWRYKRFSSSTLYKDSWFWTNFSFHEMTKSAQLLMGSEFWKFTLLLVCLTIPVDVEPWSDTNSTVYCSIFAGVFTHVCVNRDKRSFIHKYWYLDTYIKQIKNVNHTIVCYPYQERYSVVHFSSSFHYMTIIHLIVVLHLLLSARMWVNAIV